MKTLDRQAARRFDQRAVEEFGVPSIVLMENAGRGIVDELCRREATSPVAICCGGGNNGGDGFVIARHLQLRGIEPRVLLWTDPDKIAGDARINFEILRSAEIPIETFQNEVDIERFDAQLNGVTWVIDALLGTGARGAPRSPFDLVIERINSSKARKLAVDVPSGLDCDSGQVAGAAVVADVTGTFVAQKPGFLVAGAERYTGNVVVLDIGAPQKLIDKMTSL